ncbi:FAD-binding monooxygenase [Mycobacterium sp. 1100029.7]|nr:FAD-binding monooxygenase [Mycobacterium sp. 1100029.7]
MTTCDVAIVGFGPTGATAANLLGGLGLNVIVVERDPDVYGRARAISTDDEVMRIWQSIGLADRLQRDMLADRPIAWVDTDGVPFVETTFTPRGCGYPAQQFLYQPAVDRALREGVARFDNVDVLLEHECLRTLNVVEAQSRWVELLLADLRTDTLKRIRASYVIAADGGSSPTRGMLGVGYTGRTYPERWVVIDTKMTREWDTHDRMRFHCNPKRPTVDCPTPLGHHRWEYPARAGEDEKNLVTDEAVWAVLHEQGITEDQVKILRAVVYSHHVRMADRWRVGGVFLAGDAAHAMPPWIGQGMAAGVRDAANLCWKLAAVVRGRAPDSLLDTYQAERQPHVAEITRRTIRNGRLITERRKPLVFLRNHMLRTLTRIPGVIEAGRALIWIPHARYRDGFLARDAHAATGWQLPQPRVTTETGAKLLLDEVIGGRWTVLHSGARPTGVDAWERLGAVAMTVVENGQCAGAIGDHDGVLTRWLDDKNAAAVVVRPDGFIYAAAAAGRRLAAPPAGFTDLAAATPMTTGARP